METGGGVRSVLTLHQEQTQVHVRGWDFSGPSSWQRGKHQVNTRTRRHWVRQNSIPGGLCAAGDRRNNEPRHLCIMT